MLESAKAILKTCTSLQGSILLHSHLRAVIQELELPVCPVPDHYPPFCRLRDPSRVRPLLYRKMFRIDQVHQLLSRKANSPVLHLLEISAPACLHCNLKMLPQVIGHLNSIRQRVNRTLLLLSLKFILTTCTHRVRFLDHVHLKSGHQNLTGQHRITLSSHYQDRRVRYHKHLTVVTVNKFQEFCQHKITSLWIGECPGRVHMVNFRVEA